jgi:hypothetical protein
LIVVGRGWQGQAVWVGAVLALGIGSARAENLDAGKSAPALFAASCSACHASARGLAKNTSGLSGYLREHYTSSPETAAALAAYLSANAAAPSAKQGAAGGRAAAPAAEGASAAKRRAGQTAEPPAAKTEAPARPHTATARPDSMIEPVEPRRHHEEPAKGAGRGKRQPAKQETAAPAQGPGESPAGQPAAASAPAEPPAAPVAAAPPPDQPAFSAPSP